MIVQATRKCRSQHCGHLKEIGDPRHAEGPATESLGGVSPPGAAIECSACMGPTEVLWRMENGRYAKHVALTSDTAAPSTKTSSQEAKIEETVSKLSSSTVKERRDACYEAAAQPHPAVVKALIRVLAVYPYPQFNAGDNEFYCTVKGAAYALGCIQDVSTAGFLLEALGWDEDQPNLNVYTWGTSARAGLKEAGTPFARSVINKYDSGTTVEPKLRRHFRKHIPTLVSKLQDASLPTGERMESCFALAMTKDARVLTPLIKALEASDIEVRRIAAFALAKIGDRSALGPLKQARKIARAQARQTRQQFIGMTVIGLTPTDGLVKTL